MLTNVLSLVASPDPLTSFAVLIGLGAMAVAFFILLLTGVIQRLILLRQSRRQKFKALWNPLLIQSITEIPQTFPVLRSSEARLFLESWNYFRESIKGDITGNLDRVMGLVGADGAARRLLQSRWLSDRLVAVVALGHLRDRSIWEELRRLVDSRSPELSLAAARALILIDAQAGLTVLTPFLGTRTDWSFVKVASMLKEAGPEPVVESLAEATLIAPPEAAARLVRCLEAAGSPNALPVVRKLIGSKDTDDQVVIACLRFLGRFASSKDLDLIRPRLTHPKFGIRVQAIKALGKIGTADDVARLIERLADENWWVRYRAAEALAGFPLVNRAQLTRLQAEHPEQQTREILAPFVFPHGGSVPLISGIVNDEVTK